MRLDGSYSIKQRAKIVEGFNDPEVLISFERKLLVIEMRNLL